MKLTWQTAFNAFIALFWTLGIIGSIALVINSNRTFTEILFSYWYNSVMFIAIILGFISIILDFFLKNKNITITYFLIFFFL